MVKKIIRVFFESVLLLALCFAVIHYIEIRKSFTFPSPTGNHAVGTSIVHWIDHSRLEAHVKDKQHPYRELMGQTWYPAAPETPKKLLPYDVRSWKEAFHKSGIPDFLLTGLDNIFTHAMLNAPLVDQEVKFPVVIVDHGIGGVGLAAYIALCEDLASHGYFVIGVNHTYAMQLATFPDGRVARNMITWDSLKRPERVPLRNIEQEVWIEDIQFVLDKLENLNRYDEQFKGKLDLEHIGMVGHSFGGSTAAQLCRLEPRIKAGINLDGALQGKRPIAPFDKPFMVVMATRGQQAATENRELFNNLAQNSYYVTVDGTDHSSFCDEVLLVKRAILFELLNKMVNGLGLLDGYKAHEITQALVVDFFDKYLRQEPSVLLDVQDKKYKEVAIEHK